MATNTYTTNYVAVTSAAVANINALIAANRALELQVAKTMAAINAKNAALRRTTKAAADAGASLKGASAAAAGLGGNLGVASGHSQTMAATFTKLFAAKAGFNLLKKAIGEVGDAVREAREQSEALGDKSIDQRDKARQLASLMGEKGVNDRVMSRIHGVGMASGMNFDESLGFLQEFEGSITAGEKKGNIRKDQKKDVAIAVAKAAVRLGLDAKTAGDMIGTIVSDVNLNDQKDKDGKLMTPAQAASSQMEAIAYGLNEGRGDVSTLAKGEVMLAAKTIPAGRMRDRSDVGAFVGVASQVGAKSGASAGTFASWMDRALNRTGKKEAKFLQEAGIADEQYDVDKIQKLKEHLDAARAASPNPAAFDPNKYLAGKGFGSEQDRAAMVGFTEGKKVLDIRLAEVARIRSDPSIVAERDADFEGSITMQARKSKAQLAYGDYVQGRKMEDEVIMRQRAAARMMHKGLMIDPTQKMRAAVEGGFGLKEWAGLENGDREQVNEELRRELGTRLENAGIDPEKAGLNESKIGLDGLYVKNVRQLKIAESIKALRDKGVDPHLGGIGSDGMIGEANATDVAPEIRAAREKARFMQPDAGIQGPRSPNAGPAGPQASNDLKAVAGGIDKLVALTAETNKLLRTDGGAAGDFEPHRDATDTFSNYRPGSMA